MNVNSKTKNAAIWRGVFALALGIVMVCLPGLTTFTIAIILGATLIVAGVFILISYYRQKQRGIPVGRTPIDAWISLLLGLCMVITPTLFVNVIMIIFGVLLAVGGIDQIVSLATAHRNGFSIPWPFYLVPALILLMGIFIMFSPSLTAQSFIMLFGITAIVFGIVSLYNQYVLRKKEE